MSMLDPSDVSYTCSGGRISARSVAAKQAAILENALNANPASEELLLVLLTDILPHVLEPSDLARKWRDAVSRVGGSPLLWSRYFGFLSSKGPVRVMDELGACCLDSTMALARHAAMIASTKLGAGDDIATHEAKLRAAECAAADAVARHVASLLATGRPQAALPLLQAALEWAAFRASGIGVHPATHDSCCKLPRRPIQLITYVESST